MGPSGLARLLTYLARMRASLPVGNVPLCWAGGAVGQELGREAALPAQPRPHSCLPLPQFPLSTTGIHSLPTGRLPGARRRAGAQ